MEIKTYIIQQALSTVQREPNETPHDYMLRLKDLAFALNNLYDTPVKSNFNSSAISTENVRK